MTKNPQLFSLYICDEKVLSCKSFFFRHLRIFRSLVTLGMSAGFTSHSGVETFPATCWLGVITFFFGSDAWDPVNLPSFFLASCGCRVVGSDYGSSFFIFS